MRNMSPPRPNLAPESRRPWPSQWPLMTRSRVNVEKKIEEIQRTNFIYNAQKLPCGSSKCSGKLALHDSFSVGLIMLSSTEEADGRKE